MNKKLSSIICFILIVGAFVPAISMAFAGKPDKGPIEKIVYIHYKKGHAKPERTPGKGPDKGDDYYKLLGAKWQDEDLPIKYVINPTNDDGLTKDFIIDAISISAEEWDSWTSSELFFDTCEIDYDATWDTNARDGRNELVFDDYDDGYDEPRVIAVCIIWGYFRGASGKGEIVEFDILFDTDFTWGDASELGDAVMDLQNIATHELGHGVGLADLYEDATSEQTMYGYSILDETKKRTLEDGDKAGIQELYGK